MNFNFKFLNSLNLYKFLLNVPSGSIRNLEIKVLDFLGQDAVPKVVQVILIFISLYHFNKFIIKKLRKCLYN